MLSFFQVVCYNQKRGETMYSYYENPKDLIFISYTKKTYNFSSHFHNNLEIVFCFSGAQTIKIGENVYHLKKGDAAIIFPNTVHEYIECNDKTDEPTEVLAIILDNKLIADGIAGIMTKYPTNPFIKSELVSENAIYAFKMITKVKDKIALLGWTYIALSEILKVVQLVSLDNNLDLAPKIVEYIDKNFKEDLNISHLAKVFGYSSSYIAHIFCDQLKIPFRTYLGAVRSEYAATQIKTTRRSLTQIASDSGYVSLNTFCRCFKKHFSMTPSQYRKNNL